MTEIDRLNQTINWLSWANAANNTAISNQEVELLTLQTGLDDEQKKLDNAKKLAPKVPTMMRSSFEQKITEVQDQINKVRADIEAQLDQIVKLRKQRGM